MSCYIVTPDVVADIAIEMTAFLERSKGFSGYSEHHKAFSDCFVVGHFVGDVCHYDTHRIYRKLYILNLQAFNGRYNENIKEFAKYKPHKEADRVKLHKHFHEYIYQVSEDATAGTPIYNAVKHCMYEIADEIAMKQWTGYTWND